MEPSNLPSVYGSVAEFVENYLSLVYRREVGKGRRVWCPQWWLHAEAVVRLDAMWRAWEHYRIDSRTGLSVWFLDHADPHMSILFDPDGPFQFCSTASGHSDEMPPLQLIATPPGLYKSS
ncbi:DUF4913 domain-containing protein [Nocardia tengchongensis]|uniref:DUF4913 domain-containing protein n=1 Tax=Nocardia tengchongensis TaxID=2055889 RepID=UPI0036CC650F